MPHSRRDGAGDDGSLTGTLQALLRELPGLLGDRVELLALELGRAASALARVVAWVMAIAILGVTAWLACCAGVVVALVEAGWHWALALLPVVAVHLAAVAFAWSRVTRLLPQLSLPATRRHLTMRRPLPDAGAVDPAPHGTSS